MRKLKITEMGRLNIEEFHDSNKIPLVVVLDCVRSLYNVGSIFRTSDAFRLRGLCLCEITACPPHPEIHKTALGAEDSVEWKYYEKTEDAINYLHQLGYTILAVEQCENSTMLQNSICWISRFSISSSSMSSDSRRSPQANSLCIRRASTTVTIQSNLATPSLWKS